MISLKPSTNHISSITLYIYIDRSEFLINLALQAIVFGQIQQSIRDKLESKRLVLSPLSARASYWNRVLIFSKSKHHLLEG